MKKRTKILMPAVLAGILCAGAVLPLPAEAQDGNGQTVSGSSDSKKQEGEIQFDLSVKAEYTVIIPQQINVDAVNGSSLALASTHANTEPGMAVNIRISNLDEDGNVTLTRQEASGEETSGREDTEPVTVKSKITGVSGQTLANDAVAASFSDLPQVLDNADAETVVLKVGAPQPTGDDQEVKAGKYSGKLDFVVCYEEAVPDSEP